MTTTLVQREEKRVQRNCIMTTIVSLPFTRVGTREEFERNDCTVSAGANFFLHETRSRSTLVRFSFFFYPPGSSPNFNFPQISGVGRCSGRGGDNGVEKKSLNIPWLADCKGSRNLHQTSSEFPVSLFDARLSTIFDFMEEI